MKRTLLFVFILLIVISVVGCDEESNPVDNDIVGSASNYYPGGDGSEFNYLIDTVNSVTGSYANVGTRYSYFSGTTTINGTEYIVQKNETNLGNSPAVNSELNFRRTQTGVYISIDTTGLSNLLPDTLYQALDLEPGDIKLDADSEINIFSYPLFDGKNWSAFQLNITAAGFDFSLVEVKASYEGSESLMLEGYEGTEAEKIKYTVTLSVPNPEDIFNPMEQSFSGYGWFAKDIGLMKLEGNALALTALNQGDIALADTNQIIRERLISHELE
jgi:hypothetical protein